MARPRLLRNLSVPMASKKEEKGTSPEMSLDHGLCVQLCDIIEKLTHSGQPSLDATLMKKLKAICKQSDAYVKYAYDQIIVQIGKDHSEIRLSAFQISDELFNRSHTFRDLLLAGFQEFMELTIESNPEFPLPPPTAAAKTLKSSAYAAIHKWNEKYGKDYKKLALGYNFLKNCKKMDFTGMQVRTQAEQRRNEEQNGRREMQREQRLNSVKKEISESTLEFKDILLQVENSLKLLLPDPESFEIHGLLSPEYVTSYHNPFRSYTQRTPAIPGMRTGRKTSDPSRIKNRSKSATVKSIDSPSNSQEKSSDHSKSTEGIVVKKETPERLNECEAAKSDSFTKITIKTEPESSETKETDTVEVKKESNNDSKINEEDEEEDFEEMSSTSSSDEDEDELREEDVVRSFGLGTQQYRMSVEINTDDISVQENGDNTDIIQTLRDTKRQISKKFLPRVQRWLEVLTKTGASESDVRKAVDMKTALGKALERISKLKVKPMLLRRKSSLNDEKGGGEDDDDDDDDFQDVPDKEDYEADIPEHLREEYGSKPKPAPVPTPREWQPPVTLIKKNYGSKELDPTTSEATIFHLLNQRKGKTGCEKINSSSSNKPSSSSKPSSSKVKAETKEEAPLIPFGTDLLHWGEDKPEKPLVVKYESAHRFWHSGFDDEDIVDKVALEAMNSRTINFIGKFEPVKWACRAPLSNGKLCPRQDRIKCPFHGKIIARDNMGQPSNPEDRDKIKSEEEKKRGEQPADWEDPQLQAEIQAATGVDLNPGGARVRGQRKSKRKYPGLTNVNKVTDTSKRRLERKVLSRKALNRVQAQSENLANKRFKDKFGNNFNYALN